MEWLFSAGNVERKRSRGKAGEKAREKEREKEGNGITANIEQLSERKNTKKKRDRRKRK